MAKQQFDTLAESMDPEVTLGKKVVAHLAARDIGEITDLSEMPEAQLAFFTHEKNLATQVLELSQKISKLQLLKADGIAEPADYKKPPQAEKKTIPFFPNFAMRELLIWLIVINILAILAVFFPWELGTKADPFSSATVGIKPEWYFLFMFQVFKFLPGEILLMPGEFVGILLFGIGILLWAIVPVWDKKTAKGEKNTILTYFGIFVIIFIIVFTILGFILD